jgi:hypothetical protein
MAWREEKVVWLVEELSCVEALIDRQAQSREVEYDREIRSPDRRSWTSLSRPASSRPHLTPGWRYLKAATAWTTSIAPALE